MKLPILYKRSKTGKIQFWEVEITQQGDCGVITKTSGQYGTSKPLENIEVVDQGRNLNKSNETTPLQQAQNQAKSDWKKKKDQGYKTLEDLGIERDDRHDDWVLHSGQHYWRLDQVLEAALPTYNTDAQGNTKPMLAQSVNWKKVTYPCLVQPKLDGVRCLTVFNGKEVRFLSRTGKEYNTLPHIKKEIEEKLTESIILDGELYSHELTFQEIVSAVKKYREDSLKLTFNVYDVVSDLPQQERWQQADKLISTMSWVTVHTLPTLTCLSQKQVLELHHHYVQEGYEGVMVRLIRGSYDQGQRSSNLLKVKEYDTNEYPFIEFKLGRRGVEDLIAVCKGIFIDGEWRNTVDPKMQGTLAEKQRLYENQPPKGTPLTVKHFGYTDDGLPRFPIGVAFRDYE